MIGREAHFGKALLFGLGAAVCLLVPTMIEKLFTQRQMAYSNLPLLTELAAPFLASLIVSAGQRASVRASTVWIALAAVAFALGDIYAIWPGVQRGDHSLWPVELVVTAALATAALIVGAAIGRDLLKRATA